MPLLGAHWLTWPRPPPWGTPGLELIDMMLPERKAPVLNVRELADPAVVGMDADRLARIDTHFERYVDDGR